MADEKLKKRIPGPLTTCRDKAEKYYRESLNHLDFDKGKEIETDYGSTWTYRLGPSDGRGPKVFFIHGINTPCHSLADIAVSLSEKGCQVLLYDLYGRGLSDGTRAKHDAKLYTDQATAVLQKFRWTKDITVVGYSMGGSIAVHLNNARPDLIKNLILLAPAGMIRSGTFGRDKIAAFRYPICFPSGRRSLVKGNLNDGMEKVRVKMTKKSSHPNAEEAKVGPKEARVGLEEAKVVPEEAMIVPEEAKVDLEETVCVHARKWLMNNHDGFVRAISDSVSHAPLYGQTEAWQKLISRKGYTKVILGSEDDKVILSEFEEDVKKLGGGADHLHVEVLEGTDHHFPMTDVNRVLEIIRPILGQH